MKVDIFSGRALSGNFNAFLFEAKEDWNEPPVAIGAGCIGDESKKEEVRLIPSPGMVLTAGEAGL